MKISKKQLDKIIDDMSLAVLKSKKVRDIDINTLDGQKLAVMAGLLTSANLLFELMSETILMPIVRLHQKHGGDIESIAEEYFNNDIGMLMAERMCSGFHEFGKQMFEKGVENLAKEGAEEIADLFIYYGASQYIGAVVRSVDFAGATNVETEDEPTSIWE